MKDDLFKKNKPNNFNKFYERIIIINNYLYKKIQEWKGYYNNFNIRKIRNNRKK
jgi:hypothetical protein